MDINKMLQLRDECRAAAPEALILIRIGDYYEAIDEDAETLARVNSVTLTRKAGHHLAGFPYDYRDAHVARLVEHGRRVAVCDLVPDSEPINRRHAVVEVPA